MRQTLLDARDAALALAASSGQSGDAPGRARHRDGAVERRAGAQRSRAQKLCERGRGGQRRRCARASSRRAAACSRKTSISSCASPAGRSRRCWRERVRIGDKSLRLIGVEPLTLPRGARLAGLREAEGFDGFSQIAGAAVSRRRKRSPTLAAKGAKTERGLSLPPLARVGRARRPEPDRRHRRRAEGCWIARSACRGCCWRRQGARASRQRRRRRAAAGRAGRGLRSRATDGQFSPQSHRLRPARLSRRPVHRPRLLRPRLRAAAADDPHAARGRRLVARADRGDGAANFSRWPCSRAAPAWRSAM